MSLELKLPPVVLLLLAGSAIWGLDRVDTVLTFTLPFRASLSALLLLAGVAIALLGVAAFRRAKTTVDPRYPEQATALVISGVYRRTRNPMYLGMLLVLVALGLYLGSGLSFVVPVAFAAYMTRFQIIPEERFMAQSFGDAYTRYQQSVRRWF
ncbi:isoprenylcysteine carboxylmethyltransferase family protein [Congregibacter variabilis]|uniref:Isoprenylcysteine carboxylmethyltransferase family protein n=1 Tax=Congregibacter variabilis TaxID=3081200 RepID=A0ABZ0I9S7_9GAMM|nr:isoprenylcysteine carboxylmethyltransferase family protein [Congregibacter sp. IMCC43200]